MNTSLCSATRGAGQPGRCPAHRTLPGGFEAFGAAQATNVVVVSGSPVDCRQEWLTANLASAPRRQAVEVTNATSGAPEAGRRLWPSCGSSLLGGPTWTAPKGRGQGDPGEPGTPRDLTHLLN